jgi:hypothetical protein
MTIKLHYLGTTEVGVMVAKQQKLPTVMIRRSDVSDNALPIPHTRYDVPNMEYEAWHHFPLTLLCTDTNEDAIAIVRKVKDYHLGFFAVAIDAEGNILHTTFGNR